MLSKRVAILIVCLGFAGCSDQSTQNLKSIELGGALPSSTDQDQMNLDPLTAREGLITLSFTKWGDVIAVDAGLTQVDTKDGRCTFSSPVKSDESTRWNPFQIYWVIFDHNEDVRNGTEFTGMFFENESHKSELLARVDGARPHGFSYLTEQAADYVNMSPVKMFDDGAQLQTVLNVSGHKAAIRSYAELVNGKCKARTDACRGGDECYANGTFAPLGNIHVVQNIFGLPKEVKQEPVIRIAQK